MAIRPLPYRPELADRLVIIAVLRHTAEPALQKHGIPMAPIGSAGTYRACLALDDDTPYELVRSPATSGYVLEVRGDPYAAPPETLVERLCSALGIDEDQIEWLAGASGD